MTRAEELRRAFDRGFTEPPRADAQTFENLLAFRAGTEVFAMRVVEVAGLFADKAITPLPSPVAELLGVAGFRGDVVPVYDLRALLGHPSREKPRWMVLALAADKSSIALAFDRLEGHFRVPQEAIVEDIVKIDGAARAIVRVRTVLDEITSRPAMER